MLLRRTFHVGCIATFAYFALAWAASAQDAGRVARCVSIQDVDERIECLEGRSSAPDASVLTPGRPRALQAGPSYDCRIATASIERAICGDAVLSEWDLRLGHQYQQSLRLRKGADRQSLIESQRSWMQQRNNACAAVAGNNVWSCIVDMTRQRIAFLLENAPATADTSTMASPSPLPQSPPKTQSAPPVVPPPIEPKTAGASLTPQPKPPPVSTSGTNPLLVLIFIVGAIAGAIAVYNNIRRREEDKRRAAERQRLVAKYGAEITDRILARVVWQGMTEEQLLESRGDPADKDYEVRKSITKETWKYGQTGKNRFSNRIFLENGIVTGWKE